MQGWVALGTTGLPLLQAAWVVAVLQTRLPFGVYFFSTTLYIKDPPQTKIPEGPSFRELPTGSAAHPTQRL